jgi:transcriptional regulator GlxA family with amidase domain
LPRRYTEARKRTPAGAFENIRVDAARRVLEETDYRIDDIARRCGFNSEEQLRGVFVRHVGISPRAYRERFAVA